MPAYTAGQLGLTILLLCNSLGLQFARVVTFNRAFIPGFFLAAAFGFVGVGALGSLVVRTYQERSRLQGLLQQVGAAALGTGLVYQLVGRGELALGIIRSAVEQITAARFLLRQVPGLGPRTLHANVVLLHPLALGIAAARNELAEPAMTQQEIPPALRTLLIQRDVRDLLA